MAKIKHTSGMRALAGMRFLLSLAMVACLNPLRIANAALTHYYNLDETSGTTAHDSYGGQNATLMGTTFDARSISGVIGNALNFTNNVYLSLPPSVFQFGTNSFSINLWGRRDLASVTTAFFHLQNTTSGNPGAVFARISANNGSPANAVNFTIDKGATADSVNSTNKITADNTFHMFSFVRESGNAMRIYVDGVLVASTNDTAFNINGTVAVMGATTSGTAASSFFVGPLDDVRIFDNALSGADIQSLFASRQPPPAIPPLVVIQDPVSQTNVLGGAVSLTGAFTNSPFAYQWYKDGAPIAGANQATLTLPSVTFDDAGDYFLSATNGAGFANTAVATLTVLFAQVGVQSSQSLLTLQHVRVAYNQPVTDSAIDAGSYNFQNNALVISNVYRTSATTVEIVTSPQVPGSNYVLHISNISGSSGTSTNIIAPGTQVSVTAPALVTCVSYDAGTPASQPSGPPDPASAAGNYWQYLPSTNVNLTLSSMTDDGGLNAWEVQDYSTASGGIGYQMPVPSESQDFARTNGWRYQVTCRMVNNNFSTV
ncbi:MAG TPA: LamG-like jellyroll fold domain-containing protein, partial [Verrucomicrobiae bacterium]|nr:LamG-like jellyroll fold domain-containing protein [Verrucomicrobiae bacterium]